MFKNGVFPLMYYTHKGQRYKRDTQTLHETSAPRYKQEIALVRLLYDNSVATFRTPTTLLECGGVQKGPMAVTTAAYLYLNVG
jgi:hypothetical protein